MKYRLLRYENYFVYKMHYKNPCKRYIGLRTSILILELIIIKLLLIIIHVYTKYRLQRYEK